MSKRDRPWLATLMCLLGVGIVGSGIAWALHTTGQAHQAVQPSAMQDDGTPVSRHVRGVAITPGREVVGSISRIEDGEIAVQSHPGGSSVPLKTSGRTQVTTTHGSTLSDLHVGDVVICEVSADGATALAIYSGQISVAGTGSGSR
ncbi:hypothetical protein P0W64_16085 [Tsukamurella sp. 8F]|uniref:hypothetical protein n=1 Tax=unclassified Tsukamurella TaxID=2633480 RepID=UPI0023B9E57D|nr:MULTISPECIES: hypothetical protein [unclassified Tsukamurella]MDF0530975.1 hypothetical protein [Tsukamurella sp. 8J]MDF0588300.1 hypothetical protein [Tsukamurella sp. 8F]